MRRVTFVLALAISMTALPSPAAAQVTLFFDDFNGPALNPEIQPSMPNAPLGDGTGTCTYLGAPNYSFGTLGGASVLRLTNTLNNFQRVGWTVKTDFQVTNFRFEMRFNTLVQSASTSIDSFIEAWLFDASNQNRYDIASPHGQNYGALRQFRAGSSIDALFNRQSCGYVDNTWYRLVIAAQPGQDIRASLFADDGLTELAGYTYAHTAAAFPNGFELGLSQAVGFPGAPYPTDVAIDWMRLTTTAVPEPGSLALAGSAAVAWVISWRRRCAAGR